MTQPRAGGSSPDPGVRGPRLLQEPSPEHRAAFDLAMAASAVSGPDSSRSTDLEEREQVSTSRPWRAVIWNDPINLMSYVVFVLQRHFGYSRTRADRLMRQVHHEGRAIVSHGSRESVEADVQSLHSYGLTATMEQEGEG